MGAFKGFRSELCRFALMLLFLTSLAACGLMRSEPPQPLTVEMLKNAEYHVDFIPGDVAQLTDGEYREEYVTDTGMHLIAMVHFELYEFGDLNGDGVEDAAVILSANAGGSGSQVTLEAVINDKGVPKQVATASLPWGSWAKSVFIEAGEITVDMVTVGPGDAFCCPTVETTQKYRLEGDTLRTTQLGTRLSMPKATLAPAAPTPQVGSGIEYLQSQPPWLIIFNYYGLWAANMDGSNPVLLMPEFHYSNNSLFYRSAISSPAQQIAVVTSERKDDRETLMLQTISLPDGKLHKLTNLTTYVKPLPPAISLWDIGNLGTIAWSPDGKKLAFIGGLDESKGDAYEYERDTDVYVYELDTRTIQKVSQDDGRSSHLTWSPDGKMLAFIKVSDVSKADVYVYEVNTGKIHKVSQGNGSDIEPTWSPDCKSILYYGEKGLYIAAADGTGSKLLDIKATFSNDEVIGLRGWRDNETAVITVGQRYLYVRKLSLYNIRTDEQTILNLGDAVNAVVVATGLKEDAGAILYNDPDNGLYLLPPGSVDPLKLDGEPTQFFSWNKKGRSFIIYEWDFQSNLCTLRADGSHKQCAPFNSEDVSTYGLIWGWTSEYGKDAGVWISGPGLETVRILDQPAYGPIWNIDNDLLFFVGPILYRTTFKSHYTDVAPIASVRDKVFRVVWMGWDEALTNKYGP